MQQIRLVVFRARRFPVIRGALSLFLLFFLFGQKSLRAQAVTFEAKAEPAEVAEGNHLEASFTLKNAEGMSFRPPDFQGFRVLSRSSVAGMGFSNGQSYSHQTWVFELEAGPAGQYTIGPATVVAGGKALRSQPLNIRVTPPQARPNAPKSPPAGANGDIFVTGEFDHTSAYVGQQITFSIKLYTRVTVVNLDLLDLPDFSGFYAFEKRRFNTGVEYVTLRGKKYAMRTLHEVALFPQESGQLTVGSAKVRVGLEEGGLLGGFLGKPKLLETQPVSFTVKPLPEPLPANFSGAVGHYTWTVQPPERTTLTTDDALSLRITIEGSGDARRFAAPRLLLPDGLETTEPKISDPEEYERDGGTVMHAEVLEYVVLPKAAGAYSFTPELVYFDPDSARYRSLKGEEIRLQVNPGQAQSPGLSGSDEGAASRDFWRKVRKYGREPFLWILLVAGAMGMVWLFLSRKKQRPVIAPVSLTPTPPPAKEKTTTAFTPATVSETQAARERFAAAHRLLSSENPLDFYDELLKSLKAYFAARLGLSPGQVTKEQLRLQLAERRVPEARITGLLTVWRACEEALYGGYTDAMSRESTWRQAEEVVQALEHDLKG